MQNKTCGECKYFVTNDYLLDVCVMKYETRRADSVCKHCDEFKPKVITNGDVILQGGMRAIAELGFEIMCARCIYSTYEEDVEFGEAGWICNRPKDKDCVDGIEAWLNAPAESEGKE